MKGWTSTMKGWKPMVSVHDEFDEFSRVFGEDDDTWWEKEAAKTRKVTMKSWMDSAPSWLRTRIMGMSRWRGIKWEGTNNSGDEDFENQVMADGRKKTTNLAGAEALGSLSREMIELDGETSRYHLLTLDLDCEAALIPSSTEGHYHLFINMLLRDEAWREIIEVLGKHGVIESGYAGASLKRGETFLRAPWVRKGYEVFDARAALEDWLEEEEEELPW